MAITKKHIAIRDAKEAYRREAEEVLAQAKEACTKIPSAVIEGDACLAVKWRDVAERAYHSNRNLPNNISLSEMAERVGGYKKELEFLRAPSA